jgi:hypothetical protein
MVLQGNIFGFGNVASTNYNRSKLHFAAMGAINIDISDTTFAATEIRRYDPVSHGTFSQYRQTIARGYEAGLIPVPFGVAGTCTPLFGEKLGKICETFVRSHCSRV